MRTIRLHKIADLPDTAGGWTLRASSVANDGSLLFLSVADARRETSEGAPCGVGTSDPQTPTGKAFRLSIVPVQGTPQSVALPPLDIAAHYVDLFPDGRILLVYPRSYPEGVGNAVIYDPASGQHTRIDLDDGISHVYVDSLARIWVGYFDEGVFGGGVGSAGLVCFSAAGDIIWSYPPDDGMADCYALNVSGAEAAMFFYTDFPLCKISSDFQLSYWTTELGGCHRFALSGSDVLFSRQYKDPPDAAYWGQLTADGTLRTERVQLQLPDGSPLPKGQLLGRGRDLTFFGAEAVYRISLT
ncbi:hypothetical protein [Bradyrhizobium sp. HKCCYLS20291]|uniref:hypothetical protein n=1 Tax=Bradyrhizobium sp. HKCCYLS20291 TaxID=3420766 RepID=UPI003EB996ED